MGKWQADQTLTVSEEQGCSSYCTAYLWIVPAKIEGKWKLPEGDLTLKQTFQKVSGTLGAKQISKGALRAEQITFNAGGARYTGKVNGNTITGTVKSGSNSKPFTATRVGS